MVMDLEPTRRPSSLPFAALSLCLAHVTLCMLRIVELDLGAYWQGLAFSLVLGLLLGWVVPVLNEKRHGLLWTTCLVLAAGAGTGGLVQYTIAPNMPSAIGVGVAVGCMPAVVLVVGHLVATRFSRRRWAQDSPERFGTPLLVLSSLLAASSSGWLPGRFDTTLRLVSLGIALVALGALSGIARRDRVRRGWLTRIHQDRDSHFRIVPLDDQGFALPDAVGSVPAGALIVRVSPAADYRTAAHAPVARTGRQLETAVAPLRDRAHAVLATQIATVALIAWAVMGVGLVPPPPCLSSHCHGGVQL